MSTISCTSLCSQEMSAEFVNALEEVDTFQMELSCRIEEGETLLAYFERIKKLGFLLEENMKQWKIQLNELEKFTHSYREKAVRGADLFSSLSLQPPPQMSRRICNSVEQSPSEAVVQMRNKAVHLQTPSSGNLKVVDKVRTPELQGFIDMSSGGNNDDFLDRRENDWKIMLRLFPVEVWMEILQSIKDPNILENLSNSSLAFRDLLLPRRVEFLFPKFWNIVCIQSHNAFGSDSGDRQPATYNSPLTWRRSDGRAHIDKRDDVPASAKWHTGIKLRMVCRTWCHAVDSWYQNLEFRYRMCNEAIPEPPSVALSINDIDNVVGNCFTVSVRNHMEMFLNHFEPTHTSDFVSVKNPFVGRQVHLHGGWEGRREDAVQFWTRADNLFMTYGKHIWYLTINIEATHLSDIECYSVVRTLLQSAPNLRTLNISYSLPRTPCDHHVSTESAENLDQLQPYIISHPLPRLENLRFLSTRNVFARHLPQLVFHELIRTNRHLCMLEIGHPCRSFADYDVSTETVPQLRELSIKPDSQEEFESFFATPNNWQLCKLNIDLDGAASVQWGHLTKELGAKFGNTLTVLHLRLPELMRVNDRNALMEHGFHSQLNLPRLNRLFLVMPNLCCLDFLLPTKNSLEHLELWVCGTEREAISALGERLENGKTIQLLSSADKPMRSNIWTLFPKLNRLKLNYTMDSRLEHMRIPLHSYSHRIKWSVSRWEWKNWEQETYLYRRKKIQLWKLRLQPAAFD